MSVRAIDHLPACVTRVRAIIWPDARGRILRTPYANRVVQSHAAVTAKKTGQYWRVTTEEKTHMRWGKKKMLKIEHRKGKGCFGKNGQSGLNMVLGF